nr:unnamed protein product [Callosobruchus analis]
MLSERAQFDHVQAGYLHKRSADSNKWQLRWFVLYQNILFYYDSESCHRPSGLLLLEGSYCERLITTGGTSKSKDVVERPQFCFAITYRRENIRQYELRALNETDCKNWIEAIRDASFNKLLLLKEELEQKHLHLLQVVESEKTAKWQYTQQCEELAMEIKKLRSELLTLKKEWKPIPHHQSTASLSSVQDTSSSSWSGQFSNLDQDSIELRKIKKVQSFFRGWLCRRRWKQIVEQYIKSPHAESMRKRNSLVFRMVEAEEEYMEQMEVLVTCFLRPFKMAASSKKPPCSHEDVNSIFLNSETVLFLHQIFLKGLTSRLENWPTLVLGDLFSMLLPMLSIYQEYFLQSASSLLLSRPYSRGLSLNLLVVEGHWRNFLTYPMHQVSETENLRKNLLVERMIVEGCDILLDVNQVFVRQGSLIQLPTEKHKAPKSKIPSFKTEKEAVRQCFLFSNHLIIATRTSTGKLHLVPDIGKIPLADALLIEDPTDPTDDDGASSSQSTAACSEPSTPLNYQNRDFKIIIETKSITPPHQLCVHLLAATAQEKAAWVSDIIQCLDNVQFNDMMRPPMANSSSISLPQSLKNDPKLFKDEADIRFSRTLNSCKVPQIRYATPERLLQRLTDLRFLSIDFLNTFLLTYRVFTDGATVLEALKKVFYSVDQEPGGSVISLEGHKDESLLTQPQDDKRRSNEEEVQETQTTVTVSPSKTKMGDKLAPPGPSKSVSIRVDTPTDDTHLTIPKVTQSSSSETLTGTEVTVLSAPCSPSNLSAVTLVGSSSSDTNEQANLSPKHSPTKTSTDEAKDKDKKDKDKKEKKERKEKSLSPTKEPAEKLKKGLSTESEDQVEEQPSSQTSHRASCSSSRSASISTTTGVLQSYYGTRRSMQDSDSSTARSSFQYDLPQKASKAGVVITSFRQSKRRSSTSTAAAAFAIATSASSNPRDISPAQEQEEAERARHKENVMSSACTMRVLNVLRHWISKHPQDFETDTKLRNMTMDFLDDVIYSPNLLPAEHKAAAQLLRMLTREEPEGSKIDVPTKESIETLSALEIAEQMTYLDHRIFVAISADEFLGQAWMKADKEKRAPHIILMTKRFNDVSRLVASEILKRKNSTARVTVIEKWVAVADICRCLHNFNGVLQICSAFTNTSTKHTMEKLQCIVTSDGRFRALRDALHRCDPPCIPYLGIYLTDLSFIEEGTPNFTSEGLLNFAKMRMVAHVIREIRHFQQTLYKIELIPRVANYLLATSLLMEDEALYSASLELEPRTSRLVSQSSTTTLK